jgi:predicted dehydrogenase
MSDNPRSDNPRSDSPMSDGPRSDGPRPGDAGAAAPVYTAAVVGCGAGGMLSVGALERSDRFRLVAVCDVREEVRATVAADRADVKTYADHRDLLAGAPVDVVCVSTYPDTHADIAHAAMATNLSGILVEKPLGDTAAAGQRIVAEAGRRGLPLAVPHGLLARATSREVIDRVRAGDIGEVRLIEIECTGWDIINAGIHWFQFALTLLGDEPIEAVLASCDASTRTYRDAMQVETEAVTCAWTASGTRVILHSGDHVRMSRPGRATLFRIVGTDGLIEFWGWDTGYRIISPRHTSTEPVQVTELDVLPHQYHLEALATQVDGGAPDYTVARSSLSALGVCEAAYASSRERCVVRLPLADFQPPEPPDWDPGVPYSGIGGGRDGRRLEAAP